MTVWRERDRRARRHASASRRGERPCTVPFRLPGTTSSCTSCSVHLWASSAERCCGRVGASSKVRGLVLPIGDDRAPSLSPVGGWPAESRGESRGDIPAALRRAHGPNSGEGRVLVLAMMQARSLQVLAGHSSDVNCVDFAGDCVLVTASGDKSVRVWEWRRGTGYVESQFSPLRGHKYGVTCVKVSPRSTMLASSSIDATTLLWNLRTGSRICAMVQAGGEAVRVCRFSPDSILLATAGDNGQVCLWDLVRRRLIRCFQKHEGAVQGICFSPDSAWLVTSCTFGVLKLFSIGEMTDTTISEDRDVRSYASVDDAHDLGVVSCDFSIHQEVASEEPFGKTYRLITCGNDHAVKLWEIKVTQEKCEMQPSTVSVNPCKVMEKHSSALTCVRFSANGQYIGSTSLDKTAVIWETKTGKPLATLSGHGRYVACCAFSRDGNLLATGSNDKSVVIWDLAGNLSLDSELARGSSPTLAAAWEAETSAKREREVARKAEMENSEIGLILKLEDHNGAVNSVDFYGNRRIASGSGDKLVRIWDIGPIEEDKDEEAQEQREEEARGAPAFLARALSGPLEGHAYSVNHVEFSPCGRMLASCSLDGTAVLWNVEDGTQAKSCFVNSGAGIRICRWSPDGTKLATAGDDERTTLWTVAGMEKLCVLEGHTDAVNAIAFTHDSRFLVTACNEGAWRFFDVFENGPRVPLMVCEEGHDLGVQGCDFSPVAAGNITGGGRLTAEGQTEEQAEGQGEPKYLLATAGNDSIVKLWHVGFREGRAAREDREEDVQAEKAVPWFRQIKSLLGHGGNVSTVRFAPLNGEILGSVATDKTARIWNVVSGTCLYVLEDHDSPVTTCAFSKDASLFITGTLDKTILVWQIPRRFVSCNSLTDELRHDRKRLADWNIEDTLKWLNEVGLPNLVRRARDSTLTGRRLISIAEEELLRTLCVEDDLEASEALRKELYWLKREDGNVGDSNVDEAETEVPHEFLCPITHEIMKEPVRCSDGFTYERAAINEWFLCGKYSSPMTNEPLRDTSFVPDVSLRNAIYTLLHGVGPARP
ncbi:hypothetical protein KM043_000247 [Ampulex compressa]|nr:hypothetical protein KM043_000247 [Ampulex compressa]